MSENINGSGIVGVHQYPESTGIFLVMPTRYVELKEGFYSFTFSKNLYTNFNPQLLINQHSHVSHGDMEKITGHQVTGMGIAGMMTTPMWRFKEHKNGLFY